MVSPRDRAGPVGVYKVRLEQQTVFRLREVAARRSVAAGQKVEWYELLRQAAEKLAAEGGVK